MDDAQRVSGGERFGNLAARPSAPAPTGSARVLSRAASVSPSRSSITRNGTSSPSTGGADVVERADVRVGQLRDDARLALEALAAARVAGKLRRQAP